MGIGLMSIVMAGRAEITILLDNFEYSTLTNNWTVYDGFDPQDPPDIAWGIVNSAFGSEGTHGGSNKVYCAAVGYLGSSVSPQYSDVESGVDQRVVMERPVDLRGLSDATLAFWYKVQIPESEFTDYFDVYVDDRRVFSSRDFDVTYPVSVWTQKTIPLAQFAGGLRILRFEFECDGSNGVGDPEFDPEGPKVDDFEGVYLDDISVGGTVAPPVLQPLSLLVDGRFPFDFEAAPRFTYIIQGSTNLVTWDDLQTVTNTAGTVHFTNEHPVSGTSRYFRLRVP
jgi:hypothetical protein